MEQKREWINVTANIIMALSNIFLVCVVIFDDSAKNAAEAAQKSANYADSVFVESKRNNNNFRDFANNFLVAYQRSNEFYKRNAEEENRARITILNPQFITLKQGSRILISYDILNTGNTPAYNIEHKYLLDLDTSENYSKIDKTLLDIPINKNDATLDYGMKHTISFQTIPVPDAEFALVISNKKFLFLAGSVLYRDAYNISHHTNFFMQYHHPDKWTVCKKFNDSN